MAVGKIKKHLLGIPQTNILNVHSPVDMDFLELL